LLREEFCRPAASRRQQVKALMETSASLFNADVMFRRVHMAYAVGVCASAAPQKPAYGLPNLFMFASAEMRSARQIRVEGNARGRKRCSVCVQCERAGGRGGEVLAGRYGGCYASPEECSCAKICRGVATSLCGGARGGSRMNQAAVRRGEARVEYRVWR